MIQRIKITIKNLFFLFLVTILISCKTNNDEKKTNDNSIAILNDSIAAKGLEYDNDFESLKLCKIYFYKANESIVPEVAEEEVASLFSNVTVQLSDSLENAEDFTKAIQLWKNNVKVNPNLSKLL